MFSALAAPNCLLPPRVEPILIARIELHELGREVRMGNAGSRAGAIMACAAFLSCGAASASVASEVSLVSVSCDKFQRTGATIRVKQDTALVDDNWDGYSLHAGQSLAGASKAGGEKKLFTMIVEACKL